MSRWGASALAAVGALALLTSGCAQADGVGGARSDSNSDSNFGFFISAEDVSGDKAGVDAAGQKDLGASDGSSTDGSSTPATSPASNPPAQPPSTAPWPKAEALGVIHAATTAAGSASQSTCDDKGVKLFFGKNLGTAVARAATAQWYPWTAGSRIVTAAGVIYAVDSDHDEIVQLDRTSHQVVARIPVAGRPEQLALAPSGDLFVTVRHGGAVVRYRPVSQSKATPTDYTVTRWLVGREPSNLALSVDAKWLFVTVQGLQELRVIDLSTDAMVATHRTGPRPMTVAVTPESRVVVADFSTGIRIWPVAVAIKAAPLGTPAPQLASLNGFRFGARCKGQTNNGKVMFGTLKSQVGPFEHPERVTAASVDPSDGAVRNVHIIARPGNHNSTIFAMNLGKLDSATGELLLAPPSQKSKGGGAGGGYGASGCGKAQSVNPVVVNWSQITAAGKEVGQIQGQPVMALQVGQEVAKADQKPVPGRWINRFSQPSGVAHHPTLQLVLTTMAGSNSVMVMRTPGALPFAEIKVGAAPRGIAIRADGSEAYVLNSQDYSISIIPLGKLALNAKDIELGVARVLCDDSVVQFASSPLSAAATAGRALFTRAGNPAIAAAGAFACATCHLDGSQDGLVWFTASGPRQTPRLAGRLKGSAPFNWQGNEPNLSHNMIRTIHRMGGTGLSTTQRAQLEAYLTDGLTSLVATQQQKPAAALTAQESEGKSLFFDPKVGCATCHVGGHGTNGKTYDVGTASETDLQVAAIVKARIGKTIAVMFDTPVLKDLWRTAPYLHDGSAKSLLAVLLRTGNAMGKTNHLSAAQRAALVAYLKTL